VLKEPVPSPPNLRTAASVIGAIILATVGALAGLSWSGTGFTSAHVVQATFEFGSSFGITQMGNVAGEVSLLALLAVTGAIYWRSRRSLPAMSRLIAGGIGVAVAYVTSELLKTVFKQQRPCAALPNLAVEHCPPPGDWSLPSNHATIAFALTTAIALTAAAATAAALPLALVVVSARVAAAEHYPHDVIDGALLGAVVTLTITALVTPHILKLLRRLTSVQLIRPLISSAAPVHAGVSSPLQSETHPPVQSTHQHQSEHHGNGGVDSP